MFSKVIGLILVSLTAASSAADSLKAYNIDKQAVTVSGVSSGGFMAVQLQVAYSATFSGAASVAGGTYWCAQGNAQRAQTVCMNQPEAVKSADQVAKAREWAAQGLIDPLGNLATTKCTFTRVQRTRSLSPVIAINWWSFMRSSPMPRKSFLKKPFSQRMAFPLSTGAICALWDSYRGC